ncbi:MAG: GMP synthase [Ignavibacteriales bacterium]|nr:MAG: GMP synthase [Ignavibacteriales bacterium]
MNQNKIKVSIIDLYNNEVNEGMRCIKEIVSDQDKRNDGPSVSYDIYETRYKSEIPSLDYDIYISSGGPGSPFEGEGTDWERKYFNLLDEIWNHNQNNDQKKYIFFICHSFQMMARHFKFAEVTERKIKSFGVLPVNRTDDGSNDILLKDLSNPFYSADFRQFQVVQPDKKVFDELGAKIIATEIAPEEEKHERAIMSVRISNEIAGTQFHPEADPDSMIYHLKQQERKDHVVKLYGEAKYFEMIDLLEQPDKIKLTRKTVLPNFLRNAIEELTSVNI